MIDFPSLKTEILRSGHVGERELDRLCEELYAEGRVDSDIVEFLALIRREARSVCGAFEHLFADVVRHNVIVDGSIPAERAQWLRRLLLAGGPPGDSNKKLLWGLKRQTKTVCQEFRQLYEEWVG
jgi:hypothetical protein